MDIDVVGSGANEVRQCRDTSSIRDAVAKRRRACRLAFMVTLALAGAAVAEDHEPVLGLDEHPDEDREALVALYHATAGPGWRRQEQEGWLTAPSMSGWEGVTAADGRVTELRLKNNRLSGSLPQELGNLARLRRLELPGNNLVGSIPDALGHLSMRFHFDLRWNSLSGEIPSELGSLPFLRALALQNNQLHRTNPARVRQAVASATRLFGELCGWLPKPADAPHFAKCRLN